MSDSVPDVSGQARGQGAWLDAMMERKTEECLDELTLLGSVKVTLTATT